MRKKNKGLALHAPHPGGCCAVKFPPGLHPELGFQFRQNERPASLRMTWG